MRSAEAGFQVDDITLDGDPIGTAETDEGWSLDGFRRSAPTRRRQFLNAYFVDNRQYVGRDKILDHIYSFTGQGNKPNWVDFIKFQPGRADQLLGHVVLRQQRR